MAGGLINIVSYVSNDLYLTGAPQITFYKMVYRRYTNFAVETVFLDFDDDIKFDYESELVPPRIADLMHKAYLHIIIPSIGITYQDVGIDPSVLDFVYADKNTVTEYEKIKSVYMNVMTSIYRIIFKAYNASNVTYATLVQDVQEYVNQNNILTLLDEYDALLLETREKLIANNDPREGILNSIESNLWHKLTHTDVNQLFENAIKSIDTDVFEPNSSEYVTEIQRLMKKTIYDEMTKSLEFCKEVQKYYFDEYNKFIRNVSNDKNNNIKSAWVKNLGHSIIDRIDINIGGKMIDRHLGIWINIWHQLTYKEVQIPIYDKLIGNVSELTNFDKQEKPAYEMYIPLTFWFNKFNGLSFPLIAMQYNDIRFTIKLRKFEQVFYIERLFKAELNGTEVILTAELIDFILNRSEDRASLTLQNIQLIDDVNLTDIWDNKGKRLHGHILMDYIYLESPERQRFAQSGHEYLIERMQIEDFDNIKQTQFDVQVNFLNPSKEIIWAFLKNVYMENETGSNECRWYDHSLNKNNKNPLVLGRITFNGNTRVDQQVGSYFDVFQPWTYHKVSPSAGINMYSFSIDPVQQQPTGSCNFSKLTDVRLFLTINDSYFRYTLRDLYHHDLDIDFKINITEPDKVMHMIAIDYARSVLEIYANTGTLPGVPNYEIPEILDTAQATVNVWDLLATGQSIDVLLSEYIKVLFLTAAKMFSFSLSMNILRLIGGYGALAYSGIN